MSARFGGPERETPTVPGSAGAYSHRDRRAHRTIGKALAVLTGAVGSLVTLAVLAPGSEAPTGAILGLCVVGAVYLGWGDRLLRDYARDLRAVRDGSQRSGFVRAEVVSQVGLARDVGRPTGRSPHSRSRPTDRRNGRDEPLPQP